MLTDKKSYIKERKKETKRAHKQTGISIEFHQHRVIDERKINLSALTRDFLEDYLSKYYPEDYERAKTYYGVLPKTGSEE